MKELAVLLKPVPTAIVHPGSRRGELLKLEWPDVDMRRKEFMFRKTKNGETRVVPMIPMSMQLSRSYGKSVA